MTEIVANEMIMLDPPSGGGARRSSARPTEQAAGTVGSTSFRRRTTTMTFRSDRRAARAARTGTLSLSRDSVCCAPVVAAPRSKPDPGAARARFPAFGGRGRRSRDVARRGEDRGHGGRDDDHGSEQRPVRPRLRPQRRRGPIAYPPATPSSSSGSTAASTIPRRGSRSGLLLPTGIGIVDSLAGETARVRVSDAFHPILVGDGVRIVTDAMETCRPRSPRRVVRADRRVPGGEGCTSAVRSPVP